MITADKAKAIAILGGLALAGFVAWKIYKGAGALIDTATDVITTDLNPVSDQNLIYRGVNNVIGCGDGSCSLGTKTYDLVETVKGWFTFN